MRLHTTLPLSLITTALALAPLSFAQAEEAMPAASEGASESSVASADPLQWDYATGNWFGVRDQLEEKGIHFHADLILDYAKNLKGGADTEGEAWEHLLTVSVEVDFATLLNWPGTFYIAFDQQHGQSASDEVGDFQLTSDVTADGLTQISELWYEQRFFEDKLGITLGKIDAYNYFAVNDNAGDFIHGSTNFPATNLLMPTYPDPALGIVVWAEPVEWLYVRAGLFDGALAEGKRTGSLAFQTVFNPPADLYIIGEAGVTWSIMEQGLAGRAAFGGWGSTGTLTRVDGNPEEGTEGFYLTFDQMLWKENADDAEDAQGVGMFVMFDWTDPNVQAVEYHIGGGIRWQGALPTRDEDALGLGVHMIKFNDDPLTGFTDDAETAIEAFYKVQLTPWISFQPDLQYIFNPGGAGNPDAIVGTMRARIAF